MQNFAAVPLLQRLQLRIRDEGYDHSQWLQLGNPTLPTQRLDLVLMNETPRIDPLVAVDGNGERVGHAAGGATVQLLARVADPDGDAFEVRWTVTGGTLSDPEALEPKWTLPSRPGNHAATLLAFDGRGGYARSAVNVSTRRGGLIFSGFVKATDQPALPGAEVDINGRVAVTDASGFFRVSVPDRKRFVMNIRKSGYGFASNIYYEGVVGGTWTLTKAQILSVNPTQDIDVQNRRTPRECQGPPSDRLRWAQFPALAEPQVQDGRGNIIPITDEIRKLPGLPSLREKPQQRECGPGTRVRIPANSPALDRRPRQRQSDAWQLHGRSR